MLIEHICPQAKNPVKSEITGNGEIKKEVWKDKKVKIIWKTIIVRCSHCGKQHEYALTMDPC